MKSAHLADFCSATTTTEESVLRSGGGIGSSVVCRGPVEAFHVPLIGIPRRNCEISIPALLIELLTSMKYQLVLQLPASSIKDYDAMIELEETFAIRSQFPRTSTAGKR